MTERELREYLLRLYPKENEACEWKEFTNLKHAVSGDKGGDIISYISAIANMEGGHLIIGIRDETLEIVGIQDFHTYTTENIRSRVLGKCSNLDSEGFRLEAFTTADTDKTVWVFQIPKHKPRLPVYAHDTAWQRIGDNLKAITPERRDSILKEPLSETDWSAEVAEGVTLDDLDPEAVALAREKFKEKHQRESYADDIDSWNKATFLDKAKITIHGEITNAAIVLLGKPESSHFILPAVAEITWKLDNEEKAYEHFGPPFLLNTTKVLHRIRNVRYKIFPDNQLLAIEVNKYETRVILEALHNCIAHQDYSLKSRVIVTEKRDRLIFENAGSFYDGKAEDYFAGEKTPQKYRNTWLAKAMVNLGMIDTMGYGIHSMIMAQRQRFFPLPDYSKSEPQKVVLEIFGHTIDENYTRLLMEKKDLSLNTIILLDRVQKKQPITDEAATMLRREGLIEGRKPRFFVAAKIAAITEKKAAYTRNRGLDKKFYKELVIQHLRKFGPTSREQVEELLFSKLPDLLSIEQKRNKVKNLLTELRSKDRSIRCARKGPASFWELIDAKLGK
jgi:ATP-dependent DNA helicase RecG